MADEQAAGGRRGRRTTVTANVSSGGIRAAVFGMSDGLVTNVSLILGVAGAHPGGRVRPTGRRGRPGRGRVLDGGRRVRVHAGPDASSCSGARRRAAGPSGLRRRTSARSLWRSTSTGGSTAAVAEQWSTRSCSDPELALETHAREELGFDPRRSARRSRRRLPRSSPSLSGRCSRSSPGWSAPGTGALVASVAIGAVTSSWSAGSLGRMTGRSRWRTAVRQLVVAAVAAGITYGIGKAVGVSTH